MREQIIADIEENKIIVIVRGVESDRLIPLANALYKGGIRLMEITYSSDNSVSDERTSENIKMLAEEFDGKLIIGAGTVTTVKQVELTKKAGGKFIVSPDTFSDVIKKTHELDMVSIPGAFTPTEIQKAHRAGADFVKLFPIENSGIDYIKAIKVPLSHIKFLVVGGINDNTMDEYLSCGISYFGIGRSIADKKLIYNSEFDKITLNAKKYVSKIRKD